MGGSGEWKGMVRLCRQGSMAPAPSSGSVGAVWGKGILSMCLAAVFAKKTMVFSLDLGEVLVKITEKEISKPPLESTIDQSNRWIIHTNVTETACGRNVC